MRTPLFSAVFAATVLACTTGSGVKGQEERAVETFDSIDVAGPFQVRVQVGSETSVTIEGDDNIVPKVVTDVHDSTLDIELPGRISMSLPLTVAITTPTLVELDASGASNVRVFDVNGEKLDVEVSGASDVALKGQVEELEVDVSGASQVHAVDLSAKTVELDASGASQLEVTASETLNAEASGASKVRVHGKPGTASQDASGASTIELVD